MGFLNPITFLAFVACLNSACGSVHIQLDELAIQNGLPECRLRWRSEATNKRTAWIFSGETLNFTFCLPTPARVTIADFVYSNDGWVDDVTFAFDSNPIARLQSTDMSLKGELWNIFEKTGEVGTEYLPAGQHTLSVSVDSADKWGIEFDELVLEVGDYLTADDIRCPDEDDGKFVDDKYNSDPKDYKCAPDDDEPVKVMPVSPSPDGDSASPRTGGGNPNDPNNGDDSTTPRTGGGNPYNPNNGGDSVTPRNGGGNPNDPNNGGDSTTPRNGGGNPYNPNNGGDSVTPRNGGGNPNDPNDGDDDTTSRPGGGNPYNPYNPNNGGDSVTPRNGGGNPNDPNNGIDSTTPRNGGGNPYNPNNGGDSVTPRNGGGNPNDPNDGGDATTSRPGGGNPYNPNNGGDSVTPRIGGGNPNDPNNGVDSTTPRNGGGNPYNSNNGGDSVTPRNGGGNPNDPNNGGDSDSSNPHNNGGYPSYPGSGPDPSNPSTGGNPSNPNNGDPSDPRNNGQPSSPNNSEDSSTPINNGDSSTPSNSGDSTGTDSNTSLNITAPGDNDLTVERTGGVNFCNNGQANYNIISSSTTQFTLSVTSVTSTSTSTSYSLPSSFGLVPNPKMFFSNSYSYIQTYPSRDGEVGSDNMWIQMGDKPRVPCTAMQFSSPDPDGNMTSRFIMRSDGSLLMFPEKELSGQAMFYPALAGATPQKPGVSIASVKMQTNGSDVTMDCETEGGTTRLGVSLGAVSTGITFYSRVTSTSISSVNVLSTMVLPCEDKAKMSNAFIAADGTEFVSLFDNYMKSMTGNRMQIMTQGD